MVQCLRDRINHEITAVTVRHHLDILRSEELISAPAIRRRRTPGRPVYVYQLAEKALEYFPNNYQNLASALLNQIKTTLPTGQVNVILERVADQMVANAGILNLPIETRLGHVVVYLNQQGYDACWEACPEGYLIHTRNCPYHQIAGDHQELCGMDLRLMAGLVGIVPRRVARLVEEHASCAYLFPIRANLAN
ncbi:MAG: hypothetical protein IT324_23415 [Anaerolineae bacterium]|nr:hypothetical protein [Anaerolineae bacterium]